MNSDWDAFLLQCGNDSGDVVAGPAAKLLLSCNLAIVIYPILDIVAVKIV